MTSSHEVVFLGATNELSRAAFDTMLSGKANAQAVIVSARSVGVKTRGRPERLLPPSKASELPLLTPYHEPTLIQAAWQAGVPVFAVDRAGDQTFLDLIAQLRPDAVCVACFPQRIPAALLRLPTLGFLNVHPSLLPFYRGPDPLFWLFQRDDTSERGVTVHLMDEGLDTGPLVRQANIAFADGAGRSEIEWRCGELGGRLLLEALEALSSGRAPQPQRGSGSYFPWPQPADYQLDSQWTAVRAYNFMRATAGKTVIFPVTAAGETLYLTEALGVNPAGVQTEALVKEGAIARVRFHPGVLSARFRADF